MMKKATWTKRVAIGVMAVTVIAGGAYSTMELKDSQPQVNEEVGASTASTFTKSMYQTKDKLNVRTGASTKHKVLLTLKKGAVVTSSSRVGNWYKVSYKGKTGYVSGTFLNKVSVSKTTYTTKKKVSLKSGRSQSYKSLKTIEARKTVSYIKGYGTWAKVKYAGKTGYVQTNTLNKKTTMVQLKPTVKKKVPKAVVGKPMSRTAAEKHLLPYMRKSGANTLKVKSNNHEVVTIVLKSKTSGKAELLLDTVSYRTMRQITPSLFGRKVYDAEKKMLRTTDAVLKRYVESQFGVNTAASRQALSTIKTTAFVKKNVNKTVVIGGKRVLIQGGVSSLTMWVR